ncbi:MAG: tetratricopeptide repeat protein [Acidobacteriia bacterium]|nr:tetratricopeptide repeat protein [Terriglobia bacterium]
MKPHKLAVLCGVLMLLVAANACNKLKARDQLNKGVGAFRNAQFQQAIVHFKTAVDLDPTLLNARLYLATAYAQQYIPGGDSPENIKIGDQAVEAFEDVLKMDPSNVTAIASIAQIYYNMKEFDKAKEYQRRRLQVAPNDPEPYYWIGVINWAIAYPRRMQVRRDLNLTMAKDPAKPDILPPLPEKARAKLEKDNQALVDEGIQALQKAIELKPNDADAMAYLNLMYREKSDYEADPEARQADLKQAEEWVGKALNIKKQVAGKAAAASQ